MFVKSVESHLGLRINSKTSVVNILIKITKKKTMEQISRCCGAKRKIVDNWLTDHYDEDVRFTYVCSNCEKDFEPKTNETTKN